MVPQAGCVHLAAYTDNPDESLPLSNVICRLYVNQSQFVLLWTFNLNATSCCLSLTTRPKRAAETLILFFFFFKRVDCCKVSFTSFSSGLADADGYSQICCLCKHAV